MRNPLVQPSPLAARYGGIGRRILSRLLRRAGILDSDGNSFDAGLSVLDSDGNSFTVTNVVLDSDGNSFTVV